MKPLYPSIQVLIVDDDEDDFLIIRDYVSDIPSSNIKADWCPDFDNACQLMLNKHYDIILVDYKLGHKTGIDFLKIAKEAQNQIPIILLTGNGNRDIDIQAMELGAVDYIIKSELGADNIERSIRYAIERKTNLEIIRTNELKYKNIFERSKDLIFIADENFRILDVNHACEEMLGYAKQRLLGLGILDILANTSHQETIKMLLDAKINFIDKEVIVQKKEGVLNALLSIKFQEQESITGNVFEIYGVLHDITSLKKIEKNKLQIEKMAAAERLVRTVAHEIRNPLNNISLSTEQIRHGITDENQQLYIDIITRNSKRISTLIKDLLDSLRPSAFEMQKYVLNEIIHEIIQLSQDRITLKKMQLRTSIDQQDVFILADKEKLKLAIINIITNAIEAMEEETGLLQINLQQNSEKVFLEIIDNGCGISEENITKLYEPYFTQKRNGMGLGLSSAHNILQAHQASIDIYSKVDEGTQFTIVFPVAS